MTEEKYIATPEYPTNSYYYKISPVYEGEKSNTSAYKIDRISKLRYDSLVSDCKDCKELDADKIRALDYEQDHGGFSIKTILLISLVVLYLIYRIYKKTKV